MNELEQEIFQLLAEPNSSPSAVELTHQVGNNSLAAVGAALNRLGILGYVRVVRKSQVGRTRFMYVITGHGRAVFQGDEDRRLN
jgi:predicted ArsR family transcriptional regulator